MLPILILAGILSGVSHSMVIRNNDYFLERQRILSIENSTYLGANLELSHDEALVNAKLMALKNAELKMYFSDPTLSAKFPPSNNFVRSQNDYLQSEVFQFIRGMPKGGALHLHEYSMVSPDWIIREITYKDNLYMCEVDGWMKYSWFSHGQTDHKCDWESLKNLRAWEGEEAIDKIVRESISFTPDNYDEGDINKIWKKFENMIMSVIGMLNKQDVFEEYFYQAYKEFDEDNVQYVEFRTMLTPICATYSNEGCWELDSAQVARLHQQIIRKYLEENPEGLCDVNIIYAPWRRQTEDQILDRLHLAVALRQEMPDTFIGFDLVGQEDLGKPLVYFAQDLFESDMTYYFHAGETNWQGESTDENLVDAVLLGSKRIGHGYAINKHPEVKARAREADIPLEICPLSNQVLALVNDLRNHPAATLIQEGYPIVVSSDDPTMWNATGISYDMYAAFVALAGKHMDLHLLKKLALNSIHYGQNSQECQDRFQSRWNSFVSDQVCSPEIIVINELG